MVTFIIRHGSTSYRVTKRWLLFHIVALNHTYAMLHAVKNTILKPLKLLIMPENGYFCITL